MKKILLVLAVLIFSGCGITGQVVQKMQNQPDQSEKDQSLLSESMLKADVSYCYLIQTQDIRESCFMSLAEKLHDADICNNLLGSTLIDRCVSNLNRNIYK